MQSQAEQFFQRAYSAFETAAASSQLIKRSYCIAGKSICFNFAGPALLPQLTRALAHISLEKQETADFNVYLFDSVSTGVKMPPPPWVADDFRERGEVRGYNDQRFSTIFQMAAGVLSIIDMQESCAVYWTENAQATPHFESGSPLLPIFYNWLSSRDLQLCHAAAVGSSNGGVLLAGKGGSGKSSTAISCLDSSLFYLADDYCVISAEPSPHAYSIYSSGKVNADNIERVAQLKDEISNIERLPEEKALFYFAESRPEKLISDFPLLAVLLPVVIDGEQTQLRPVSAIAAIKALAPSTIFQLPGADAAVFRRVAALAKVLPCYELQLGSDAAAIPGVIERLISEQSERLTALKEVNS